jgi:hypothetical protein
MLRARRWRLGVVTAVLALVLAATATAGFIGLPSDGSQVNNDPANGIDPARDAGLSDVVGGSLAGGLRVPWATFEQKTAGEQQIFVRAFKNGQWVTQGKPASLNIDANQEAEAPSIDFAGANRTVPWVAWYEPNTHTGNPTQIFASRFNAAGNVWVPEGQDRAPDNKVPSLNINLDRTAENPAVAGGAAVAGAAPVPWVAWEENDGGPSDASSTRQIFVSKGVKQAAASQPCAGFKPSANASVSQFCWQQVGIDRLSKTTDASDGAGDPSLNIDPSRDGVEPDFAFTGAGDVVAWVVWYEKNNSHLGLNDNEQVFAARIVQNPSADGGFSWKAVGSGTAGQTNILDRTGATHAFGNCTESKTAENACSLNADATRDAEDPRVAAGTVNPAAATAPWVVWSEETGPGTHGIFVARLIGGDHFETVNGGKPISNTANDASKPDITFSHNTPYVSWNESIDGVLRGFHGHFEGDPAAPTFVNDSPDGETVDPAGRVADLRAPISSGCTSDPFSHDGSACPGAAIGTPFFTFAEGNPGSQKLFAKAYQPGNVVTGPVVGTNAAGVTVRGQFQQGGAPVSVHVEFGPTTDYGASTDPVLLQPASGETKFTADLTRLPAASVVHYRAVVQTDFGTLVGQDRKIKTAAIGVGVKIDSRSARKVLATHVLRVEGWANRKGSLTISARLGRVALGKVSTRVRSLGRGPRVTTHKLAIHLTPAGLRALRVRPHGTITATAVMRAKGRHARISATRKLGT